MRKLLHSKTNENLNTKVNANLNTKKNNQIKSKFIAHLLLFMLLVLGNTLSCLGSEASSESPSAMSSESNMEVTSESNMEVSSDNTEEEQEAYYYQNEDTGYYIWFDDQADLLTDDEEYQLYDDMYEISNYGHVGFVSIEYDPLNTVEAYARVYYQANLQSESGTIFLIDMDKRKICIYSNGAIYNTITSDYADTITDNVYQYASNRDYYGCASAAYRQILTVLDGGKIAQPMKYICNFFLAIIVAILLIYFYVSISSSANKASDQQLMQGISGAFEFRNVRKDLIGQKKRYSPRSSGGGGGGGGGHSGGGGGGGGGGSHSF